MVSQGGSLAACVHRAASQSCGPIRLPGNQIQPGPDIHLDHVRRGATSVPRPLHTLHRAVWRDADFQRPPRRARSKLLQGVPDCHGDRCLRRRGRVHPPSGKGLPTLVRRDAAAGWHGIHGGITVAASSI